MASLNDRERIYSAAILGLDDCLWKEETESKRLLCRGSCEFQNRGAGVESTRDDELLQVLLVLVPPPIGGTYTYI